MSIFTISLKPILSKIPEKIHSLRPAAGAAKRHCLAEKFSLLFYFARADFFLLKGKENFSAWLTRPKRGAAGLCFRLAGENFLLLTPSVFARSPPEILRRLVVEFC